MWIKVLFIFRLLRFRSLAVSRSDSVTILSILFLIKKAPTLTPMNRIKRLCEIIRFRRYSRKTCVCIVVYNVVTVSALSLTTLTRRSPWLKIFIQKVNEYHETERLLLCHKCNAHYKFLSMVLSFLRKKTK